MIIILEASSEHNTVLLNEMIMCKFYIHVSPAHFF